MQTLQSNPWSDNNDLSPPWEDNDEQEHLADIKRTYEQHKHLILKQRKTKGKVKTSYNFPVPDHISVDDMMSHLDEIYEDNQNCFKINISIGLLLQHLDSGSIRYFVPYHNETVFTVPIYVRNRRDLERIRNRLAQMDISEYFRRQRPNTKWSVVLVTKIVYEIYNTSYPLGSPKNLPSFITKNKNIVSMQRNPCTNRIYTDNLCFFRCLAYHKLHKVKCALRTKLLHKQWINYVESHNLKTSNETIDQIPDLERCFRVNVNVFKLQEDKTVTTVYKSREQFMRQNKPDTMNLNVFENHLSYITRFRCFAKKVECLLCGRLFPNLYLLKRHDRICDKMTKFNFPGGFHSSPKTIFEKLGEIGIQVEKQLQHYPWLIVYDMEALLLQCQSAHQSIYKNEHRPVSVCIDSNVPGYDDARFIFEPNEDELVKQMIQYMYLISDKAYELSKSRWKNVFDAFDELENKWNSDEIQNRDNDDISDACTELNNKQTNKQTWNHRPKSLITQ